MSLNEATLQQAKRLRVDALYGKKKHYNAAERKRKYHRWFGIPAVVLNVMMSSLLFGILSERAPEFMLWVVAVMLIIVAALSGLQTFLNFEKAVEGHRRIGTRYLGVAKECARIIAYAEDGATTPDQLREQIELLARRHHEINLDAEQFPTNGDDYRKAQAGFSSGEESYTSQELEYKGE